MNALVLAAILTYECSTCKFEGDAQRLTAQVALNRAKKEGKTLEDLIKTKKVFQWAWKPYKRQLTKKEKELQSSLVPFAKRLIESHKQTQHWFFDRCSKPRKRFKSEMAVRRVDGVCFY